MPTCNAEIRLADDYGDNAATLKCQLPEGHIGPHTEVCRIQWDADERELSDLPTDIVERK